MSQFLAPTLRPEDDEVERSLRPRRLDDFVGQERVKEQLGIALEAAMARGEALDHVLLVGPPGPRQDDAGADRARGARRRDPHRGRPGARAKGRHGGDPHRRSRTRDVLFVDEIHRINRAIEEILYPALEDFRLDIVVGQGPAARTLTLDLPPFTLVGATTRTGLLTTPLRDRFGMTFRLGYYEPDELATIVRRSAGILGVEIDDEAADEIARRARGTPRIANRILRRVRDVAEVRHAGIVTTDVAREALQLLEVDEQGLERIDRELLDAIAAQVRRRPGGAVDARGRAGRGARHGRGRLRAVPAAARLPAAHAARSHRSPTWAVSTSARSASTAACSNVGPMTSQLWVPGMAGPLEELVNRIHRRIAAFQEQHQLTEVAVSVELIDGSLHRLATLSAEPGFGFLTLCPHCEAGEPEELIVPLGAVREIRLGAAEPEQRLGFSGPAAE